MHPAYSVIVFTCASGAGYGLLALLGGAAAAGRGSGALTLLVAGFVVALALVTIGLLSSTAHLGRPERAWRAFSQWRTSWLSREGVAAIATYAVAGLLALSWLWVDDGNPSLPTRLLGAATAVAAIATLWCTGMIYASLRTIPAWSQPLVAPLYVLLGLMTGSIVSNALIAVTAGAVSQRGLWVSLLLLLAGWITKTVYWNTIDTASPAHTVGSATGLGHLGRVRPLDPPHTGANFVMREMGYAVARRHAQKLRGIAALLLFVLPILATLLMMGNAIGDASPLLAIAAVLSAGAGILVERWLFFAQAVHVSMLYYGREAV